MTLILTFLLFINSHLISTVEGKVISIADGYTITILTEDNQQIKIRLHGIDCPEKKQPFGMAAKQFTSNLVFGKTIKVKITDIDRYGRSVGIVYFNDSEILNEKILAAGLAWHYTKYDQNPAWDELEKTTRNKKAGLWIDPNAVAPWCKLPHFLGHSKVEFQFINSSNKSIGVLKFKD
ncbi:nuclease [Solitalea longa]|uniref:Nuclease n=1 Tax=Solitalea longa TaxID=2079460 RepID=A0A2S4ZXI7_9SPHI|nr:thermonuclease family protein [Solitalea longa]POY34707.1 nuclease [Solitalea longa]